MPAPCRRVARAYTARCPRAPGGRGATRGSGRRALGPVIEHVRVTGHWQALGWFLILLGPAARGTPRAGPAWPAAVLIDPAASLEADGAELDGLHQRHDLNPPRSALGRTPDGARAAETAQDPGRRC